jgi:hypothetical protein
MQGDSLRLYGYKRWKNDGENIRRTIYSTVEEHSTLVNTTSISSVIGNTITSNKVNYNNQSII